AERCVWLDERARPTACLLLGRDGGDDDGCARGREARRDPADPRDVGVAVLLREPESLRELSAHDVAVEVVDEKSALLELGLDDVRHRRLAGCRQSREPDDEDVHGASPTMLPTFLAATVRTPHST